jgi:dolichol-phosphate mannosyltransferase
MGHVGLGSAGDGSHTPATPQLSPVMQDRPTLSIVIAALNEQDNVAPLIEQVRQAVIDRGIDTELIIVDDGSTDQTLARLTALQADHTWLRLLQHERNLGQSAAWRTGIAAARGNYIATLDADLQNDPADLPEMMQTLIDREVDLVQGNRKASRKDSVIRKFSSWVGRTARRCLVSDRTIDTGCSARVMGAGLAKQLPLQYKGMHRFIPAYARIAGAEVIEVPVNHRPRTAGTTKYGMWNRGLSGLVDCFAVRWMFSRYRVATVREHRTPDLE